jgi:hypothetical protein
MGGATVAPKKVQTDEEKNVETLINYGLPFVLLIYLGLVLKKYSLADFSGLVTNDYLLLGKSVTMCAYSQSRPSSLYRIGLPL